MNNKPFANLKNMLDSKNNVAAPRRGTAQVPVKENRVHAANAMNDMMNKPGDVIRVLAQNAQNAIPFGSHAKDNK